MSKSKARVFVPLTKVDEEKRLVYGTMTQEVLDKSGEVMDYDTSKPHFEDWSAQIHEASGGLSKGNLRVMHGLTCAGKVTEMDFNDEDKSIEICTKVVDDTQWNMVLEGCYTGFSVGGSYAKRWTDNGVKKFTAKPNEVSLVDNPCVPSATFSMIKADGAEEQIEFKVENDDDLWPAFSKAEADAAEEETKPEPKVEKTTAVEPTNAEIANKATEIAKAANDGSDWMSHIEAAREALIKGATSDEGKTEELPEEQPNADKETDADADDAVEKGDFEVANRLKGQKWVTSDDQTFDKKADALAHEQTLIKSEVEPTEAEKLKARLEKATSPAPTVEETPLFEDLDRLSKVFDALSTPFDDAGQPKLEKGMYTVNRFSNVLSDMASLSRTIKAESVREKNDAADASVSTEIIGAVKTLGNSFLSYAKDQVTELLAGMDDEILVSHYDYYYSAAQDDSENALAKDVCSVVVDYKDESRERRETLVKAFGFIEGTLEATDDLSPPMQKRFDALESENAELRKVATEAVDKVEELAKRMQAVEDTPLPRAPTNIAFREGDFFGKRITSEEEKADVLKTMLEAEGADGLALKLIKAAQRHPIQITPNR